MFFPWLHALKMDEAGEPSGGADALINPENVRVELGIPHEVDEPTEKTVTVKKETPVDDGRKTLEADLAATRRQLADVQASERYWAAQARARGEVVEEVEEEEIPADPEITETAEQFLDDVGKRGMKAITDRGFMTKAQVAKMVADGVAEANSNLQAARTDATFDAQLAAEFPEIAADGARVRNGEEPKSELYKRASPIFKQMVKLDPQLATSKSALIMAARTAAAEIKAEGKKADVTERGDRKEGENSHEARRNRIDRQRSDRSEAGGEEVDGTPQLSMQQKDILRHLKVSEQDFIKHSDRGAAAGGRRGR